MLNRTDLEGLIEPSRKLVDQVNNLALAAKPMFDQVNNLALAAKPMFDQVNNLALAAKPMFDQVNSLALAAKPMIEMNSTVAKAIGNSVADQALGSINGLGRALAVNNDFSNAVSRIAVTAREITSPFFGEVAQFKANVPSIANSKSKSTPKAMGTKIPDISKTEVKDREISML